MRQAYRKQHYLMLLTLLALAGFAALFVRQGIMVRGASGKSDSLAQHAAQVDGGNYLYYTVKQSSGFVLARAAKGSDGQPLSMPQPDSRDHFWQDQGRREPEQKYTRARVRF